MTDLPLSTDFEALLNFFATVLWTFLIVAGALFAFVWICEWISRQRSPVEKFLRDKPKINPGAGMSAVAPPSQGAKAGGHLAPVSPADASSRIASAPSTIGGGAGGADAVVLREGR